jgi:hypothetical protein
MIGFIKDKTSKTVISGWALRHLTLVTFGTFKDQK